VDQVFHIGGVLRSGFLLFLIGTLIGYPVSIYFDSLTRHRLLLAPALGLSLWGAITLPIFFAIKFSYFNIVIFALIIVLAFNAVNWRYMGQKPEYKLEALFKNGETSRLGYMWVVFAALLSLFPALAAAPHFFGGGVGFGAPIFDHEKVALIDEIVRTGMPARNPFFQMAGTSHLLNYYYGWYFLAAQAAMLAGASGWETDIGFTFRSTILGFLIGTVAGSALGLSFWWSKNYAAIVQPYVICFESLPKLALAPLIVLVFGIGIASKIAIATALTLVVSTLTAFAGVKAVDADGEKLFYSLGATRAQVFRKFVIPSCLPWIISVLRVNIGLALTGAIVGEFIASQHGLGRAILYAGQTYDIALVWVAVLVLSTLAVIMYVTVSWIERWLRRGVNG